MRVLLLTDNYWPRIGGAETYALELARGLVGRGHDVVVYTDGERAAPGLAVTTEGGVSVIRDSTFWEAMGREGAAWEQMCFGRLRSLSRAVDLASFDVIHANNHDTAVLGSILKLETGAPLVLTAHEVERDKAPLGGARTAFVIRLLPLDAVIAVSDYYAAEARRFGAERVHRVNFGIDTAVFAPAAPRDRAFAGGRCAPTVTCLARFKQRKGLEQFVQAARLVRTAMPDTRFVLAGSTSSASADYLGGLYGLIDEVSLGDCLRIWTNVTFDRVPQLLRSSDVVVQPSFAEGLGVAVLEAMSCEVPVVCSRATGLTEIVEHEVNGLLAEPGDAKGFAAAISRLLVDRELRRRLGGNGRKTVAARYDLTDMIHRTESIYEHLLDR
jgi:glycosyltransferase involved in cell wall biosynthesis